MKNLTTLFCVLLIGTCCFNAADAQTRSDKKAARIEKMTQLINSHNYIFVADNANPTRGGTRTLTGEYDLTFAKDSVIAFLPYFGRAYLADYSGYDEGIKFTWTDVNYQVVSEKKGNTEILITPKDKDKNIGDAKAVQSMRLNISSDGYASLQIISYNRDPIIFYGTIEERKIPKVQASL